MSDTEMLRRAATLMRQRAEAATPGPWWAAVGQGPKRRKQQIALVGRAGMRGQGEAGCIAVLAGLDQPRADDAEHIAAWHPGVALAVAVADLLDNEASLIEGAAQYPDLHMPVNEARCDLLLDVARAYLGEETASTP